MNHGGVVFYNSYHSGDEFGERNAIAVGRKFTIYRSVYFRHHHGRNQQQRAFTPLVAGGERPGYDHPGKQETGEIVNMRSYSLGYR